DNANLVRTSLLEDDGELGLCLGGGSSGRGTRGGSSGDGDRSGGGDAPLGFKVLDETGDFENRLAGEPLDDLFLGDVAHDDFLPRLATASWAVRLRDVSPSAKRWMFGLSLTRAAGAMRTFENGFW